MYRMWIPTQIESAQLGAMIDNKVKLLSHLVLL